MRVGGVSRNKSAVKVAMDRRYKDYSLNGPLTQPMIGEALKRLRNMVPAGPRDQINVDETIYQTMKNAGEIEIVFDRSLKDRLKVILAIDNGGWSMDPYIPVVQTLFDYARAQFKDVKTYFFHNTIYGTVWEDPGRYRQAQTDRGVCPPRSGNPADPGGRRQHGPLRADGHRRLDPRRRAQRRAEHRVPQIPGRDLSRTPSGSTRSPERMWGYTHTINAIRPDLPHVRAVPRRTGKGRHPPDGPLGVPQQATGFTVSSKRSHRGAWATNQDAAPIRAGRRGGRYFARWCRARCPGSASLISANLSSNRPDESRLIAAGAVFFRGGGQVGGVGFHQDAGRRGWRPPAAAGRRRAVPG